MTTPSPEVQRLAREMLDGLEGGGKPVDPAMEHAVRMTKLLYPEIAEAEVTRIAAIVASITRPPKEQPK